MKNLIIMNLKTVIQIQIYRLLSKERYSWLPWLKPVIPATQEVEIERIMV
jgi:hypothetical protein